MLDVYVRRFDMMGTIEKFLELNMAMILVKRGVRAIEEDADGSGRRSGYTHTLGLFGTASDKIAGLISDKRLRSRLCDLAAPSSLSVF